MPYEDKYIKDFRKESGKVGMQKLISDRDTY
jgi:hypothetical protein